jgi:osmotically-inducible protein OsmY
MRDDIALGPVATVAAAFALGAASVWLVYTALQHRRIPETFSDDTVEKRVRDRVAQVASDPQAIQVDVEGGVVRLSGDVASGERDAILSSVLDVPGVFRVRNALGVAA